MTTLMTPTLVELKAAFRRLTRLCGGEEAVAALVCVDKSVVNRWGNPNYDRFRPPADVVVILEKECGVREVTVVMDRLIGQLSDHDADDPCARMLKAMDRAVRTARALHDAVSPSGDGGEAITPREYADIKDKLAELRRLIDDVERDVDARHAQDCGRLP